MALSAARASLRDEAPEGGLVACWILCEGISAIAAHNPANCCIGESPDIYQAESGGKGDPTGHRLTRRYNY